VVLWLGRHLVSRHAAGRPPTLRALRHYFAECASADETTRMILVRFLEIACAQHYGC